MHLFLNQCWAQSKRTQYVEELDEYQDDPVKTASHDFLPVRWSSKGPPGCSIRIVPQRKPAYKSDKGR